VDSLVAEGFRVARGLIRQALVQVGEEPGSDAPYASDPSGSIPAA
jgi:hypothetical protein